MNSKRIIAVGLFVAAITLSVPALAIVLGEVRHIAAVGIPPLPPEPQEPTNQRLIFEALTRVNADGGARFIAGLGIVRHRVKAITGLQPNQLAGTAIEVSIDRGLTNIGTFRASFEGFLPDDDGIFQNQNGQNVPFASWEILRRSENGLLVVNAGTGTVNESVAGHPDIPNVLTGDVATLRFIRFAGTPAEVVLGSALVPFD